MSRWMPWNIARKEMKVILRKKSVIGYVLVLPIVLAAFLLLVVQNDVISDGAISSDYSLGFTLLVYFFVIFSAIVPSSIASYSIVGEKVEKSLEPLLATPVTDGEILLGKTIAAFLPPIVAIWAGAGIFMAGTDYLTRDILQFYYFPNLDCAIMLLILSPLAAIMSIQLAVIASSRVTDVRGANQVGGLMFIPFMAVFVAAVEGSFPLTTSNLFIASGAVAVANLALFYLSKSTFRREEILTKWK